MSAALNLHDELLRAAVYQVDGSRESLQRVLDVHRVAPLLELAPVIDAVAAWLNECRRQEEAAELDWYAAIERRIKQRRELGEAA